MLRALGLRRFQSVCMFAVVTFLLLAGRASAQLDSPTEPGAVVTTAPARAMESDIVAPTVISQALQTTNQWELTLPSGGKLQTPIVPLGNGQYDVPGLSVLSGVYELKGDRLVAAKPVIQSFTTIVWRVLGDGTMILIEQAGDAAADYRGAMLKPLDPPVRTPVPTPVPSRPATHPGTPRPLFDTDPPAMALQPRPVPAPVAVPAPVPVAPTTRPAASASGGGEAADLAGQWELYLPRGNTIATIPRYTPSLSASGGTRVDMRNGGTFSGIYDFDGKRLTARRPFRPDLVAYVWQMIGRDSAVLVEAPAAGQIGPDYHGAMLKLVRADRPATTKPSVVGESSKTGSRRPATQPSDFTGQWEVTLSQGAKSACLILPRGSSQVEFRGARAMSGTYAVDFKAGHLTGGGATQRPEIREFVWQIIDADTMLLIDSPTVPETGIDYRATTLKRVK